MRDVLILAIRLLVSLAKIPPPGWRATGRSCSGICSANTT